MAGDVDRTGAIRPSHHEPAGDAHREPAADGHDRAVPAYADVPTYSTIFGNFHVWEGDDWQQESIFQAPPGWASM